MLDAIPQALVKAVSKELGEVKNLLHELLRAQVQLLREVGKFGSYLGFDLVGQNSWIAADDLRELRRGEEYLFSQEVNVLLQPCRSKAKDLRTVAHSPPYICLHYPESGKVGESVSDAFLRVSQEGRMEFQDLRHVHGFEVKLVLKEFHLGSYIVFKGESENHRIDQQDLFEIISSQPQFLHHEEDLGVQVVVYPQLQDTWLPLEHTPYLIVGEIQGGANERQCRSHVSLHVILEDVGKATHNFDDDVIREPDLLPQEQQLVTLSTDIDGKELRTARQGLCRLTWWQAHLFDQELH
mmetsp:Transcript_3648/g.9028  ORF Transcript_3648/g.9028 Transcript_3648/m.9028 type:complete len:296 (-) Transcript_3648:416-1303(-)